jgi:hypothetical protein
VVAVKLFEALRLDQADQKVLHELRSEAQMMERLSNHPNIVKFVGAITKGEEGSNFALVTEFCPRGSLYDLLVRSSLLWLTSATQRNANFFFVSFTPPHTPPHSHNRTRRSRKRRSCRSSRWCAWHAMRRPACSTSTRSTSYTAIWPHATFS